MLVEADAIEAELVGQLELVQVAVVDLVATLGVVQIVLAHDPGRIVGRAEVCRQIRPRHEVERVKLHGLAVRHGWRMPITRSAARRNRDALSSDRPISRLTSRSCSSARSIGIARSMISFSALTASGELAAMRWAIATAASTTSPDATIWFSSPTRSASFAETSSPVNSSSFA